MMADNKTDDSRTMWAQSLAVTELQLLGRYFASKEATAHAALLAQFGLLAAVTLGKIPSTLLAWPKNLFTLAWCVCAWWWIHWFMVRQQDLAHSASLHQNTWGSLSYAWLRAAPTKEDLEPAMLPLGFKPSKTGAVDRDTLIPCEAFKLELERQAKTGAIGYERSRKTLRSGSFLVLTTLILFILIGPVDKDRNGNEVMSDGRQKTVGDARLHGR